MCVTEKKCKRGFKGGTGTAAGTGADGSSQRQRGAFSVQKVHAKILIYFQDSGNLCGDLGGTTSMLFGCGRKRRKVTLLVR